MRQSASPTAPAILSAFGLYELYVSSLAQLNFQILLPALLGLLIGALVISALMNLLIKHAYTATFSVIFGLFLAVIPTVVMQESCRISSVADGFVAVGFALVGALISLYFGDIKKNNARISKLLGKK